jgi:hypothetical protein
VELFRKKDSRFYWYDFKVRGQRYRRSTKETNKKRAEKIAALKLSQAMEGNGLLDRKAPSLQEFSTRFLASEQESGKMCILRGFLAARIFVFSGTQRRHLHENGQNRGLAVEMTLRGTNG